LRSRDMEGEGMELLEPEGGVEFFCLFCYVPPLLCFVWTWHHLFGDLVKRVKTEKCISEKWSMNGGMSWTELLDVPFCVGHTWCPLYLNIEFKATRIISPYYYFCFWILEVPI
jgi:hypothetical protein